MGLFDYVKNMGSKVFGADDSDAAEKIKEHILSDNPGVENLEVTYDDGTVCLTGECQNYAARDKTVLLAGNVKDVEKVEAEGLTIAMAEQAEPKVEYYEIKSGDSLSKIAKEYYGNAMDYPKIFEANKEVIKDPNLIYPGQKIRIPMDEEAIA